MHQSIATIDSPEFINLQPMEINPLMSSCEIKVLYLGENRNHSYISKDVATEMAKTLRGAPIVGYYKEQKEDFADHGEQIIFDDEGIKFNCLTRPYGFVAPDAKVWFQKFEDTDDFGNVIEREYLMTTGFLWTGQYEECQSVVEGEGKPHSMEFDKETMQGNWSTNVKTGMDFFIINDAIFSKLCILGEDVEPCFEGSSVTAPKISTSFTKVDDNFRNTLYNMMQELRFALKGGQNMANMENKVDTPTVQENSASQDNFSLENQVENQENTEGTTSTETVETPAATADTGAIEFAKEEDKKDEKEDKSGSNDNSDDSKKDEKEDDKKDKDNYSCNSDDEDKKKYSLLQQQYDDLSAKFSAIEADYQALKAFKTGIEDKEKDALIARFYMLNDEDKKDIVDNKSKYSLDDIEAKLSIIYTKKKLAAEQTSETSSDNAANVTTYNLPTDDANGIPDWIKAVREVEKTQNF
jgi:hypothetical protein